MVHILTQCDWTGKLNERSVNSELTGIEEMNITLSLEPKSNTCEITLKNPRTEVLSDTTSAIHKHVYLNKTIQFNEGDTIKIYAKQLKVNGTIDTTATSDDLIMSATLEEFTCKGTEKSTKIKLKCVDKTYSLLNMLWSYSYDTSTNKTTPEIIQSVIRSVTSQSSGGFKYDPSGNLVKNGIYTVDARLKTAGGLIEDTRQNGSAFPVATIAKTFKPAYEFIADLSSPEKTNTAAQLAATPIQKRSMIFYIDELNRFNWFYPKSRFVGTLNGAINNSVTTITLTDASSFPTSGRVYIDQETISYTGKSSNDLTGCTRGDNVTVAASHTSGSTVSSAINLVYGDTTSGYEVLELNLTKKTYDIVNMVIFNSGKDLYGSGTLWYYYNISTQDKSLKMVYKPWLDITTNLINEEIKAGNLVANAAGSFTFQEQRYNAKAYGGGFSTKFGVTVTDDTTYNNAIRNHASFNDNSVGLSMARNLTKRNGSPRWKGTITTRGYRYRPGDMCYVTALPFGLVNQELRIMRLTHNITRTGWTTSLVLEEDEAEQT